MSKKSVTPKKGRPTPKQVKGHLPNQKPKPKTDIS